MRKIIIFLLATMMCGGICSCESNGFEFLYDAQIVGQANGDVNVGFPNGSLVVKGECDLAFKYANDTLIPPKRLSAKKVEAVTLAANEEFEKMFTATSAEGFYELTIDAVLVEKATGIEVKVHKVLTNK